jgi:CheY-like chemotaxis protein
VPETIILNVDDRPESLYAKSRMLKVAGYTVIEARNGEDGLKLAREQRPDGIVLDIKLPDMTGWEVTRRLKADPNTAHIPVLQVSATFTGPGHAEVGRMSGASAYLVGPVEGTVLADKVGELLAEAGSSKAL